MLYLSKNEFKQTVLEAEHKILTVAQAGLVVDVSDENFYDFTCGVLAIVNELLNRADTDDGESV